MIRSSKMSKVEKMQEKAEGFQGLKIKLQAISSRGAQRGSDQSEPLLPAVSQVQNAVLGIQQRFAIFLVLVLQYGAEANIQARSLSRPNSPVISTSRLVRA